MAGFKYPYPASVATTSQKQVHNRDPAEAPHPNRDSKPRRATGLDCSKGVPLPGKSSRARAVIVMEAGSAANCQSKARLLESPDKSKWRVLETEKRLAGLKPEIGSQKGSVSISVAGFRNKHLVFRHDSSDD